MLQLQKLKGLEPTKTWQRPLKENKSTTAATAQSFYIDIPKDHFIHEIIIQVGEGTVSPGEDGLADDLTDIKLVGNGTKYFKDAYGLASFFPQIERMNGRRHQTGIYHLVFSDPAIPETRPLPAWVFTSLQLILTDNAPAATKSHFINVVVVESAYQGEDLSSWKLLYEKIVKWANFGTNIGWWDYEHERAYKVFSYLYALDDNGTLSSTIFNKIKLVGRHPRGETIITDEIFLSVLRAENQGTIIESIDNGFAFLQFLNGFPSADFSSLYTKFNIPTAGTKAGVRVMERYIL